MKEQRIIKKSEFASLIPAAGLSSRMGVDKCNLKLPDGQTFIENLVNFYLRIGASPVVLVVNENFNGNLPLHPDLRLVVNSQVDKGRSFSIQLGVNEIPDKTHCFLQNLDNPFVSVGLYKSMVAYASGDSYLMPTYQGKGGHPVLLGHDIVSNLKNLEVISDFRTMLNNYRRIDFEYPDARILWNINTEVDYQSFLSEFKNLS